MSTDRYNVCGHKYDVCIFKVSVTKNVPPDIFFVIVTNT